jgi:hypothetical protein
VTEANVNDIVAAKEMPIDPGATYVFDRGYYDYGWWAALDAAGCRIVTRFKSNTPLGNGKDIPLGPGSEGLSDKRGVLPKRQANSRSNPMQAAVREIVVMTENGTMLRILGTDLDAPADEIAALYKQLADRAVLPSEEADLDDHPLHRSVGECRVHSGRGCFDRFLALAHAADDDAS